MNNWKQQNLGIVADVKLSNVDKLTIENEEQFVYVITLMFIKIHSLTKRSPKVLCLLPAMKMNMKNSF